MAETKKVAADYTVQNSSINEPTIYAHMAIMPGSVNEPLINPGALPKITSLVPNNAVAGSGNLTMTVTGTGFADWSVLMVNNIDRTPTFVSNTQLTTIIRPSTWPKGVVPVNVKNGSFVSNALPFTFT